MRPVASPGFKPKGRVCTNSGAFKPDAATPGLGSSVSPMQTTITRTTPLATASPGSDALAPSGSVEQVSNRQAEPLLRRKDGLHVAFWNVRTLQDVGVQALTMRDLRNHNVDIACLSEVRIPDRGHSPIKLPGEEACYYLYHSGVVDNTGRYGVAISLSEAAQAALLACVPNSSRLASARLKGTTVNLNV